MEQDGKTYLIYDKYAVNNSLDNKFTKNITVETLFLSDYNYFCDSEALHQHNEFCEKNDSTDHKIPANLLDHNNLYSLYYFVYSIDGLEYRILILCVDNYRLEQCFNQNNIPEKDFLIITCNWNRKYQHKFGNKTIQEKKLLVEKNIKEITTFSLNPNSDPTDPIEHQPECVQLSLFEYQKKSIKWMLDRERGKKNICFNQNEILLGNIVCDWFLKKFIDVNSRDNIEFHGGALIDEVGLGKTYQIICVALCNPPINKKYVIKDDPHIYSKATLIICPNHLVGQWCKEVEKVVKKEHGIKVIPFYTKTHMNKYTYQDILDGDFIVTSFNFLKNQCFLQPFVSKISKSKSYFNSEEYEPEKIKDTLSDMRLKMKDDLENILPMKNPDLLMIHWHRIVVDEFHELYTNEDYKTIKKVLYHFDSYYKWCLTGTPFDKSDDSLYGMFNFITNYKDKNYTNKNKKIKDKDSDIRSKEIWLNEKIIKYMTTQFFRRNTKKSVEDENKLPPLKGNIVNLNFSKTEWMIYNAFLANPNVDKFSVTLRQLCCHPKIAEELKSTIANCKSLDEIEKVMVKHYESMMKKADQKVRVMQYKIKCLQRKLKIAEWKQYARCLRQIGYKVKFELDDDIDEKYEEEMINLAHSLNEEEINIPLLKDYDDILKDDEETKDNKKKKLIIVSHQNKDKIIKLTNYDIGDKTMERVNLENAENSALSKLKDLQQDYIGKRSTYDYYTEVMGRLKKTTNIEKNESDSDSDSSSDDDKETCGICLDSITGNDLGVTKCGHIFCYNCVKPFIEKKNKCPMCNKHTKESEIYMIAKEIPKEIDSKEFKDKRELVNIVGTKLANLIFFLKKNDKHAIIFSQWDDMLRRVGDVLNEYGIKNVFCRGNVWQRNKAIREFNSDDKIKIIMLSSESAASGTNLTKAEMVILLDPVYGTYEYRRNTEWQAIGRAYRTGQTKQVQVVRFIIKETVEETIYNMNKKSDQDAQKNNDDFLNTLETKEDNIELDTKEIEQLLSDAKKTKEKKISKPRKKKIEKIKDESESDSDSDSDSENEIIKPKKIVRKYKN